ncbi:MAG: helix-turn-helix domain-containing protein [Clostridia bacterium]|nr:helix-turn-helix domain-containing protein [Clostridia bacterium]
MKKKIIYYRDWDELPVLLTLSQVAILLDITHDTAQKWARAGKIPAVKVVDEWRVEKQAIREMFNQQNVNRGDIGGKK